ncbi:derlin-2 [Heterostelium album PN500]|uniref:Derlin n=1 Tax=Heterostelium pallidum (strain ATCC 26659 / Pp 5 / PN500) TaxID=670386 RepID=D3BM67_HETP5|nr:derlin-2 [Heterostelium album PN500]EFA77668.1 derlin-2 [Heterostelium album PN500]|eukprot:XP_020429796.1 derlin-2 [Heterostelium album PN500]
MAQPFEDWYKSIPIVTRIYMSACVVTSVFVYLDVINPLQLYLNFPIIFNKYEVWRLLTTFLFFDEIGLNFLFHIVRHSKMLEEGSFRGRAGDYLFMWIFGAVFLLIMNAFLFYTKIYTKILFLAPSLAFMIVYIWSRRNPNMHISFLGLFTFSAPYLPWVILGVSYLMDHSLAFDIMGIVVGHVYYYLEDVYPQISNRRILKTPSFIKQLFDNPNQRYEDMAQQVRGRRPAEQQQQQQQQQQEEVINDPVH